MTQTRVMIDDVFKGNRQTCNSLIFNRWAYDSYIFGMGFYQNYYIYWQKQIYIFICTYKIKPNIWYYTLAVFLPVVLLLSTNIQLSSISNQSMKTWMLLKNAHLREEILYSSLAITYRRQYHFMLFQLIVHNKRHVHHPRFDLFHT